MRVVKIPSLEICIYSVWISQSTPMPANPQLKACHPLFARIAPRMNPGIKADHHGRKRLKSQAVIATKNAKIMDFNLILSLYFGKSSPLVPLPPKESLWEKGGKLAMFFRRTGGSNSYKKIIKVNSISSHHSAVGRLVDALRRIKYIIILMLPNTPLNRFRPAVLS